MASVPKPTAERAFKAAIQKIDESLFKSKGIHIKARGTGHAGHSLRVTLRFGDVAKNIAWLDVIIFNASVLVLEEGWTVASQRGKGYGTILRALVCKAAKNIGLVRIEQLSSALTEENMANSAKAMEARRKLKNAGPNNNIENLKKAASWRPVSAYIMNKLGFEINKRENSSQSKKYYSESRSLNLKYGPTPKLNAVVNAILRPPNKV
jgi:hypothetical protein